MFTHEDYLNCIRVAKAYTELLRNSDEEIEKWMKATGARYLTPEEKAVMKKDARRKEREERMNEIVTANSCPHCGRHLLEEEDTK